jgi:phosphoribosylamine--glycine ligase
LEAGYSMRVLVIGRGGREHAIVAKLARDGVEQIFCAPGNVGMTQATCVAINDDDVSALADFASGNQIDLTIVGPESSLVAGVVDEFQKRGLAIFGPNRATAQLEGSKAFAKALMAKYGIPTAAYQEFTELDAALEYLRTQGFPIVIKADGLAAGKGVVIPQSLPEAEEAVTGMLSGSAFGEAGRRVVIEEFLDGEEFSLMAFADGQSFAPMPVARDYKRAFDGDQGLNTGGMGANSPHPLIDANDYAAALQLVIAPTLAALDSEGIPFTGVLYAGLIKTKAGIKVIEFNVRFGDPETEVVLPRLETPLTEVIEQLATADLPGELTTIAWSPNATVGVVLAAAGYPGEPVKGAAIHGLDQLTGVEVLHMGTASENGEVVTAGGRVLCVVGQGENLAAARENVYRQVEQISCPELFFRSDIAAAVA